MGYARKMKDARQEQSVFLKRQSVRRRRDWTRRLRQVERGLLSTAIVMAGLALLYGLYLVVFTGEAFAVKRIVVDGEWKYLTAEGLGGLSGVREGDNLFWISVADVHSRLATEPWVKATAVRRRLPDTLMVYVEEHRPAALLALDSGLCYVDADGATFKWAEGNDDRDFPVLSGLSAADCGPQSEDDSLRLKEMLLLMELFRATGFGKERDVAEVHFDRITGYSLVTKESPSQILFGHSALAERAAALDRMGPAILSREGRIQYMLANEPGRIIVKYGTI